MKRLYPCIAEAERERSKHSPAGDDAPDFIAGAPNYDKFQGWSPEEIMVWLNVD